MKKFVLFCILAWFSFLQGLLIRSSRRFEFATLFSFYYHDRVFTPLKNRLYNMNSKRTTIQIETRTFLWPSHLQVLEPSLEVRGFEDLCSRRVFYSLKNDKRLSYCQSTEIFYEPQKRPFLIKDITVYE